MAPAIAALLLASGAGVAKQQGGEQPLTVHTVRFFQPGSGTTTIDGVCELRLSALASEVAAAVRYRFEVAVADSAGLELEHSGWTREVPPQVARARGATVMESFGFAAAPGLYRMHLRAVPERGTAIERDIEVRAYVSRPPVSDLVLGVGASRVVSDTDVIAPGEIRRAGLAMRTAPVPRLSPTEAALTYYAELYPWAGGATAGELWVDVLEAGGRGIVRTPARAVRVDPQGGATRGSVDLTGLPEGSYRLRLSVRLGDSTLTVEAPFRMGALAVAAADVAAAPGGTDRFEGASEAQLDSLYAPLTYLIDARTEAGIYGSLSADGKRRFLREFWRRRAATAGEAGNRAMSEFYGAVAYTNDAFRQSRAGSMLGWRTDRGRIYLRYGRPDEVLRRPVASPRPYEVWKYTRDRPYWYVFSDRNGLGDYTLIGTNDRREPGLPEWQRYLEREGAEDVNRFLGLASTAY